MQAVLHPWSTGLWNGISRWGQGRQHTAAWTETLSCQECQHLQLGARGSLSCLQKVVKSRRIVYQYINCWIWENKVVVHSESSLTALQWVGLGIHQERMSEMWSFWRDFPYQGFLSSLLCVGHISASAPGLRVSAGHWDLMTAKGRRIPSIPALSWQRSTSKHEFPSTLTNSPNAKPQYHFDWDLF